MYSQDFQHQHERQQGAMNRSDPHGYQTWGVSNVSTPNSESLRRKRNQAPLHNSRPPLPASADRRGPIYNSFTSTYHGLSYSDSKRDPPPNEGLDLAKTRRVIFSKQLEIHEKQRAQSCSTPTIPILKTGNRTNKGNAPTPRSDSTSNTRSCRDPTPRSGDRGILSSEKRKTINDILEELSKSESSSSLGQAASSSDPPIDPIKRSLFSPSAKSPRDIFSKIALRDRSPNQSVKDTRSSDKRQSMEPEALASQPLLRAINNTAATVNNSWDISDLFPDRSQSSTPQRNQTRPSTSVTPSLRPGTFVLDGSDPSKDHWDNHNDSDPWSQYLSDRSPSNSSTESQEAILIRKDSRNPRHTKLTKRPARTINDDDSYNTNYPTPETPRVSGPTFRNPLSASIGRRNKENHEKNKYAQLGEDGEVGSYGTEVVLIERAPPQNAMEEESPAAASPPASPPASNRGGFGSLLRRGSCKKSTDQVTREKMPTRAMSFDDSIELKKGTDDTSDSDSGVERKQRNRRWNTSDRDSASSHYDDDDSFLPYYGGKLRDKWKIVFMLVCLVICCLCIGLPLYQKLVSAKDTTATTSPTPQEMDVCVAGLPSQQKYSERYQAIRKIVQGATIGYANKVDEPGTAQRKALCWMADFDTSMSEIEATNIPAIIQRYTMAVLYYSMVDEDIESERSLKGTDYLSPSHECEWSVVMCGLPKTVTALLLSDKDLRGSIPPEIANLASLSFLELSLNYLSGTIPTTIETLSSLEYFAVAFNSFSGSIPSQLGSLVRLEFINMRSSQVSGRIPPELGQLVNLQTLLLEGNWLSGTIPQQLGNLISSQQMSFRENYLTGRVSNDICELRDMDLKELKVDSWIECDCCTD